MRAFRVIVGMQTIAPVITISPTGPNGMPDPADLPLGAQPSSWSQQRSDLREIVIELNNPISAVASTDLILTNLGMDPLNDPDETIVLRNNQLIVDSDGMRLTLRTDANQLSDGVYQIDLMPRITGGQPYRYRGNTENRFFVLRGDFNGSGGVNIQDFATFSYWFGNDTSVAPNYVDTNDSGGVNIQDFADYAENFGKSVVLPVVAAGVISNGAEGEQESLFTLPPETAGDIDGDGVVSERDALEIRYELERDALEHSLQFDSNHDEKVSSADILFVINRMDPVSLGSSAAESNRHKDTDELLDFDSVLSTLFSRYSESLSI
jgi:hypothetical protein